MNSYLHGKDFDFASAHKISSRPGRDSHEELYQDANGAYFLVVHCFTLVRNDARGSAHLSCEKTPKPNFVHHKQVVPLSPLTALEWCLNAHVPEDLQRYLAEYLFSNQTLSE